jgi:hypothetical protein
VIGKRWEPVCPNCGAGLERGKMRGAGGFLSAVQVCAERAGLLPALVQLDVLVCGVRGLGGDDSVPRF